MIRLLLIITCLINIQGCAVNSVHDDNFYNKDRENQLIPSIWKMTGRITIKHDDEALNARIKWHQEGDKFICIISGSFGRTLATIEGTGTEITTIKGRENIADIERIINMDVLISDLRYWLLGQPNPASPYNYLILDQNSHEFIQNKWQIHINEFQTRNSYILPKNIQLTNSQFNLRLFIDNWQL
jgi:outer membrane lipoprotein LolB